MTWTLPGGLDVKTSQDQPGQESRLVKTPKPYSSGFCSSSVRRMPTTTFITLLTALLSNRCKLKTELTGLAMSNMEDDMPVSFFCPITGEVLVDPVVARDGHTYEAMSARRYSSG